MKYNFCSDNTTAMAPEILDAIGRANVDSAMPYGNDLLTRTLRDRFCDLFDHEVSIFPVATGTAANGLALAQLTPPFGAILCHRDAHILVDECSGPEFFSGGARLFPMNGARGKVHADDLDRILTGWKRTVHNVVPAVVSLTQLTEWGTAYAPVEVHDIGAVAKAHGLKVHMDGARFANAVAGLGCHPAETTWKAGVDALSFGASKNGCMGAEVVVFFNSDNAKDFEYRRKRAGHLWSKSRFLAAQVDAYLENGNWLSWARHANAMAERLAEGLHAIDPVQVLAPVEGNELFLDMPDDMVRSVKADGFHFHDMPMDGRMAWRMVTAWNTPEEAVDAFLESAGSVQAAAV